MGIPGLTGLLKRHAPQSLSRTLAAQYRGQTVAIDTSCPLNRFIYSDDPHPYRHLQGFALFTKYCDRHDITPIFVFDGQSRLASKERWEHRRRARGHRKIKASLLFEQSRSTRLATWLAADLTVQHLESDTINDLPLSELAALAQELTLAHQNAQDRERYTKTVRDLSGQEVELMASLIRDRMGFEHKNLMDLKRQNDRLLASYGKRARRITSQIKQETLAFVSGLGYPCLVCENHEAEALCANLVYHGKAHAIVSEDTDSIVFGDAPLLRYFFTKNKPILQMDPVVARHQLGLTRAEFLDLCILCGTDFGSKIAGVGPNRALQLIKEHRTIEQVLVHLDPRKYIPEEGFDYRSIRKVFTELPEIPKEIDADKVPLDELLQRYQLDPDDLDHQLNVIMQLEQRHTIGFGNDPFSLNLM